VKTTARKRKPKPKKSAKESAEAEAAETEELAGDPRGPGQPTLYQDDYCAVAKKLCELGATDADIAEAFGVARSTIFNWRGEHPEFNAACKVGKEAADDRVEESLYRRAVGYDYKAVKIFANDGAPIYAEYMEHLPPETAAAIFWLCNRRSKTWRQRHEVTGKDGAPIGVINAQMPLADAVAAYAQMVAAEPGSDPEEEPSASPEPTEQP
jgi:hypothetical protein